MKWVRGLRRITLVVGIGIAVPLGGWIALDTYLEASSRAYRVASVAELDSLCQMYRSDIRTYASASCAEDDQNCLEQLEVLRQFRAERDPEFSAPYLEGIESVFWRLFPDAALSGEDAPPVSRMCGDYLTSLQIIAYPMPTIRYWEAFLGFLLYAVGAAFVWWIIGPIAKLADWLSDGFNG